MGEARALGKVPRGNALQRKKKRLFGPSVKRIGEREGKGFRLSVASH